LHAVNAVQVKADAVTEHEAEAKIEHVQEAYEVLSSHKLRQQYDKIGYSGVNMPGHQLIFINGLATIMLQ
jgi:DnaJ-class molecular chaperone